MSKITYRITKIDFTKFDVIEAYSDELLPYVFELMLMGVAHSGHTSLPNAARYTLALSRSCSSNKCWNIIVSTWQRSVPAGTSDMHASGSKIAKQVSRYGVFLCLLPNWHRLTTNDSEKAPCRPKPKFASDASMITATFEPLVNPNSCKARWAHTIRMSTDKHNIVCVAFNNTRLK